MADVPDHDHILRLVSGGTIDEDRKSVNGTAFRMRDRDVQSGTGLSVNWIEHLAELTKSEAVAEIWSVQKRKLSGIRARHCLAELNVGKMRAYVAAKEVNRDLEVHHHPIQADDSKPEVVPDSSHAGIHGYMPEEDIICTLIAQAVDGLHDQSGGYEQFFFPDATD